MNIKDMPIGNPIIVDAGNNKYYLDYIHMFNSDEIACPMLHTKRNHYYYLDATGNHYALHPVTLDLLQKVKVTEVMDML